MGFLSGIAGANLSHVTIVVAGFAEIFAAAFSMGIGTYLSTKSQVELMKRKIALEKEEIETVPVMEKREIERLYRKKGFRGKELGMIVNRICSDKRLWLNEMLVADYGIIPEQFENPTRAAFVMFITFFVLALIPLLPYLLLPVSYAIVVSIILTVSALFIVGAAKTQLTKKIWWKSGLEMLLFGIIAALVTYYLGEFIAQLY